MLASVVVGAAAGAVVGKFAKHKLESGLQEKMGEALPPGAAGVIVAFAEDQRLGVEQALPGSPAKSLVHTDRDGLLRELKASLAEASGKFHPDRTVCRSRIRTSAGRSAGRSISRLRTGRST
jgi:arylsulfatase